VGEFGGALADSARDVRDKKRARGPDETEAGRGVPVSQRGLVAPHPLARMRDRLPGLSFVMKAEHLRAVGATRACGRVRNASQYFSKDRVSRVGRGRARRATVSYNNARRTDGSGD